MRKLSTALIMAIAFSFAAGAHAAKLKVGDAAPPLTATTWAKGEPIKAFEKGTIYVVEFWATWCAPCKQTIPHLSALATKYKDKVVFAGVNIWDSKGLDTQSAYTDKVTSFANDQGNNMNYNVGLDDMKGTTATTWMRSPITDTIPMAFVIGKDGKIALICHPMALERDDALQQIVSGQFNYKSAKKKWDKEDAEQKQFEKIMAKASELAQKGEDKEALAEVDRMLATHPQYEERVARFKFGILFRSDEKAATAYARKLADGVCKNDMSALVGLSEAMTHEKTPDYDTALLLAQKAVDLAGSNRSPFALAALASAHFGKGNIDKAIEYQTEAVRLIDDYPGRGGVEMSMQEQLNKYKAAKK